MMKSKILSYVSVSDVSVSAKRIYRAPYKVRKKVDGQLVMLGYDVTTFTPASYQRCRLQRP